MWEKSKRTTKCEKRIVTYNVGTAQCEDGIVKCKKKVREPHNVTKKLSYMMLESHNVRTELSNVRKKSKGTTKCEKRTVTCDVETTQCENGTVKCEKKVRKLLNVTKELP